MVHFVINKDDVSEMIFLNGKTSWWKFQEPTEGSKDIHRVKSNTKPQFSQAFGTKSPVHKKLQTYTQDISIQIYPWSICFCIYQC